ncbi:MAG: sugar phosphate isomerase/epimerase family protein, partial [Anaerolineaceae bacterium]
YHKLSEAAEILDEVDNRNLGILADVFHINIEEADTEKAILDAKDWIKHVQLGDNNRLLPGQGQFHFEPFFNGLKKIGYTGYLAFECIAPMGELGPLRESLEYLHGLQIEFGM